MTTTFGDRVRSWVADNLNGIMPDYEWHDFAKIWQTPGDGEKFWADQLATSTDDRAAIFEAFGVGHEDAVALASAGDETMAACILDLYRSALPNTYADWNDSLHHTASRQAAETLGARIRVLEGAGHWWVLQKPAETASILTDFISSVD